LVELTVRPQPQPSPPGRQGCWGPGVAAQGRCPHRTVSLGRAGPRKGQYPRNMSRAGPTSSGVHRQLLVVAVLAILLGILGMHALNTHSAMVGNGHQSMSMSVDRPATSAPATADTYVAGEVSAASTASTASRTGAPGSEALAGAQGADAGRVAAAGPADPVHDMGEMAMLCVFMILAAAGLALLALLLLGRVPATFWLSARQALNSAPRRLVDVATGAGPPPVWAFSVIRC